MEELQARHRKEAKDLQNKITSKKKQATKKTRKGVNDECDALEQELKERHAAELQALSGGPTQNGQDAISLQSRDSTEPDLADRASNLSLNGSIGTTDAQSRTSISSQTPSVEQSQTDLSSQARRPNRARARLERRRQEQEALFAQASQEASNIPDLKAAERERMVSNFKSRGLVEKEIRADGHCLYSAFADQMENLGMPLGETPGPDAKVGIFKSLSNGIRGQSEAEQVAKLEEYKVVRKAAADYMEDHGQDFEPFLEESIVTYVHKVRDTAEWGGQMELLALARTYGVQINVLQGDGRVEEIKPENANDGKICWLAYYRYGFGLGEHYNSLRKNG